jgi:hypothetical protein
VKSSALRILLTLGLAFGLASCFSSDAPNLATEDLAEPAQFAGEYFATDFPEEKSDQAAINGSVEAIGDRTFRLIFSEGEHKDAPVLIRLLKLNDGNLLGVMSDPDPAKGAMYAMVTHASNGGWVFRVVEFQPGSPSRTLRDALMRHGAEAVAYSSGNYEETHVKGSLSAANLRALFADPDFTQALDTAKGGFRLSPKLPLTAETAF